MRRDAARYLREIAATHSPYVIDLVAHLIHLLYTRGYGEALHYDRAQLERHLRARPALSAGLPAHRTSRTSTTSCCSTSLHENGHPPNHTAGGINMNFFPVGPLVRRSGVFFIRRTFKDNPVYKFVLQQYIDYLIEKRFSLEWYIEGGRSRSGKLLPPRFGMLAYVVDAYRRGKSEDVYLIPVSIAYDQIQDVGDYVAEQRGAAKQTRELRLVPAACCAACAATTATSTSASASRSRSPSCSARRRPAPSRIRTNEQHLACRSSPSRSRCASTA